MIGKERILYLGAITLFAAGCFFFRIRSLQMAENWEIAKTENERMSVSIENSQFELDAAKKEIAILKDRSYTKYLLRPKAQRVSGLAVSVYQSREDGRVYVVVDVPFSLDRDKQYQLWGVKGNRYFNAGRFQVGLMGVQKLSTLEMMDAFAITIEPMGKVVQPSSRPILEAEIIQ